MIVFETLAALTYALLLRGTVPSPLTGAGVLLLVAGVVWALRVKPEPLAAAAHPASTSAPKPAAVPQAPAGRG